MWELDCEENWVPKNWCFWSVVLEKTLESPLDCQEIQPVHPKGDQSWVFIGSTDVEAEVPILHVKGWLVGKDPDAGRDWGQEEKGTTEDEVAEQTQWTWVWVNSGSLWWTGSPGVLRFMGSQRVRHDWATEPTDWRNLYIAFHNSYTNLSSQQKFRSLEGFPQRPSLIFFFFWPYRAACRTSPTRDQTHDLYIGSMKS